MARHTKNPTHPGLLQRLWPLNRRRTNPLDRLCPAPACPKWAATYRAVGVAKVSYLPQRPLLTLAGEHRSGRWS
jgi:hypothetical protein